MKKSLFKMLCFGLFSINSFGQSAKYDWSKSFGSTKHDQATFVTTDMMGNIYTAGTFSGTADLDPGPGVYNFNSFGMHDIFLIKQDPSGGMMWVKNFGGAFDDAPVAINLDPMGNIYLTGTFMGAADFNPGIGGVSLVTSGDRDIFLLKLDHLGNVNWAKRTGGPEPDMVKSTVYDKRGFLYSTGFFRATADLNPSNFITNFTAVGNTDIFITKYDLNGNYIWARAIGTNAEDTGNSIATDDTGNVYVVGTFNEAGDFNPGAGVNKLSSIGQNDIFLLKLNSSGIFVWVKQIGGNGDDIAKSIKISDSGNIYITGSFNGKADFDPNTAEEDTAYLEAAGNRDMFITKLDLSGNLIWVKNVGTTDATCSGITVDVDFQNNVFVAGNFTDSIDFDPDTTNFVMTSQGMNDVFVTKFDKDGAFKWVKTMGGAYEDSCTFMSIDNAVNIYTVGSFNDTADFNPAKEKALHASNGNSDPFMLKLAYCTPLFTAIKDTSCEIFVLDGVVYDKTGIYKQTITSVGGCEEFVTLDIDIHHINDTVTVSSSGKTLTSQATGVSYQWIGCKTKMAIPGATGKSYIALGNAQYAVALYDGRCRDTSACVDITSFPTSIEDFENQNAVQIYPNPTNGVFVISVTEKLIGGNARIFNLLGQKVRDIDLKEMNTTQNLSQGFYIIEIKKDNMIMVRKIIVE
ncbi:MAG: SBBP repeat-containing protein [Chitinophagaceae bacterium]|nr:SBBP repeat-containing protein [Chitinophagaceae bacterium]